MPYSLADPQPAPRDAEMEDSDVGPGLYPDETAYLLDTGELVAVSVKSSWLQNGGSVEICAWVRAIDAAGQTVMCGASELEIEYRHTFDAGSVTRLTVPVIATEVLKAMLGEDPATEIVDGDEVALVPISPDARNDISIRVQLATIAQIATMNLADLL